jgi:hypothetical protein
VTASPPDIQQTYRNRAAAFREFIAPHALPVSRAKFYADCLDHKLVQTDKSVRLADLLAYVKTEFSLDPVSGQSLADRTQERERAHLEVRKLRAEVEQKERANRKEDDRWLEVVEHETQMAAFAGRIEEALQQVTTLRLMELLYLCGGDAAKASAFNDGLAELFAAALTDAVRSHVQHIAFEEDEEEEAAHAVAAG